MSSACIQFDKKIHSHWELVWVCIRKGENKLRHISDLSGRYFGIVKLPPLSWLAYFNS